jgi:hypothetical protein
MTWVISILLAVAAMMPAQGATKPLAGWATVDEGQGPGHAAAGPALRRLLGGDPAFRGDVVTVTGRHGSVVVRLTDFCACGNRHGKPTIIDLDETDFAKLTGRGPGVEWVVISSATSSIALPATDTEE